MQTFKVVYSFLWEARLGALERHLPYGMIQCNLPPDTDEHPVLAPHLPEPGRLVLSLHTQDGWKAELTLVVGYIPLDSDPVGRLLDCCKFNALVLSHQASSSNYFSCSCSLCHNNADFVVPLVACTQDTVGRYVLVFVS